MSAGFETRMTFSKIGIDHSLDFVKGFAIICVLLNHCLDSEIRQQIYFGLWGLPAVPLFLLVQVFHAYKQGFDISRPNLHKLWTRALRPFVIVEVLIILLEILQKPMDPLSQTLGKAVFWGGRGPGSYYPWVFFQFAIVLPFLAPLFRKVRGVKLALLFLVMSIAFEMICSIISMPGWLYRLLCFRYFFLIYLGYLLVNHGAVLNKYTLLLSAISIVTLYYFDYANPDWRPWFFQSTDWPGAHWICYFYIVFPMMYLLARFFYWLPPNEPLENVVCKLGRHSYAIFIFQLFFYAVIARYVKQFLAAIGHDNTEMVLYIILSLVLCTVPVISFVSGKKDLTILYRVGGLITAFVAVVVGLVWWWSPFYTPATPIPLYQVKHQADDTLRVIMVGDSWAHFHVTLRRDSLLEKNLRQALHLSKVTLRAQGKGGMTSGEIYDKMSNERTMAADFDLKQSLQPLIETGPDYCIISAGINDARQRRGKNYYVVNYMQIIQLLLHAGIRPVIIEVPEVEVDEAFQGNTLYYRLRSQICMYYLQTGLRGTQDYRQALKEALVSQNLMDSVLYIPYKSWNPDGWRDKRDIYVDDHFHLNLPGYAVFDSCLATEIAKDYKKRRRHIQ